MSKIFSLLHLAGGDVGFLVCLILLFWSIAVGIDVEIGLC
jgi:hypothetical protein